MDSKAGKGGLGGHKTDLQGGPGVDHGGDEKRPTASTEHLVKSDLDGSTKVLVRFSHYDNCSHVCGIHF